MSDHLVKPAPWMADAACIGVSPDLFFPSVGDSVDSHQAKAICAGCPVRRECLDYALTHGENWGIWGGLAPKERRRIRRNRLLRVVA